LPGWLEGGQGNAGNGSGANLVDTFEGIFCASKMVKLTLGDSRFLSQSIICEEKT
jgi:hypothetical protein